MVLEDYVSYDGIGDACLEIRREACRNCAVDNCEDNAWDNEEEYGNLECAIELLLFNCGLDKDYLRWWLANDKTTDDE